MQCLLHNTQKRALDPLELEVHTVVCYVLGTWNQMQVLCKNHKCWATSLTQIHNF